MNPIRLTAFLVLLAASTGTSAQQPARPQASDPIAQPSIYAVNSAALASAMTWCSAKHGGLTQGSPGAACFSRARGVLAGFGLNARAEAIDAACSNPAEFNTCLTPHIGRLVYALHDEFARQEL